MYVDFQKIVMQFMAAVIMLLMFCFRADAVHYNGRPSQPTPVHHNCCHNDNEHIKTVALVAVGLAVVSLVVATKASENNRGHIVLAQF